MLVLERDDVLIIVANYGCDPAISGTDHTREFVLVMIWHKGIVPQNIGVRETFADVGATISKGFG